MCYVNADHAAQDDAQTPEFDAPEGSNAQEEVLAGNKGLDPEEGNVSHPPFNSAMYRH